MFKTGTTAVCIAALCACTGVNEADTTGIGGTGPQGMTQGETWSVDVSEALAAPMVDASAQMYLPASVANPRAIVWFSDVGVGPAEFEHEAWRAFAADNGLALVLSEMHAEDERVTSYDCPDESAVAVDMLRDALGAEADLDDVPVVFWGHSAGAYLWTGVASRRPEMTAAYVAFHGTGWPDRVDGDALFQVPMLATIGEFDHDHIRDATVTMMEWGRENDARWTLGFDQDAAHWDADGARDLGHSFIVDALDARLSNDGLVTLQLEDAWLGALSHGRIYDEVKQGPELIDDVAIAPYTEFTADPRGAQWLISESFAHQWADHHDWE